MGKALYRTYRSRNLSEVVGQQHITDTLARAIKAGKIGHAYLFTGPRGTGKTSVARIMAHEINKLPYSDAPNLDIIEIDAASNRRIDDIRDLREKVHIAPVSAAYKVYIIDEVHMLTGESFNALLKTLEEPPSHVVFILATTEVHKLPATIISRTQRFTFRPGSIKNISDNLAAIAKKENINIEPEALAIIAEHAGGSFRDSLSLLDQLSHISSSKITAESVRATLGLAPQAQLEALCQAITSGDYQAIATITGELEQQGSAPGIIAEQLSALLLTQAISRPSLYGLIDALLEVARAYNPTLKLLTALATYVQSQPSNGAAQATAVATKTYVIEKPLPPKAPAQKPKPEDPQPAAKTAPPLTALGAEEWSKVLAAMKAKNPPIFAVLKQAMPVLEDDALLLKFKFALHSKKLEDPKQKAYVTEVIFDTLGARPILHVATDKSATPFTAASDPAVAAVAAIMGGGELM